MKTTKTIVIIFILSMITFNVQATVRTVSNSPSTTLAQFNTIQAAVDASTSGDTIYVHGSPVNYAGFGISNMRLVIIGPGWSPNKTQAFTANVAGFDITGTGSTGTEIQGIVCTGNINIKPSHPDSLRFIRNKFGNGVQLNVNQNSTTYSGFLFEGNVFSLASVNATSGSVYRNFVFQNNYLLGFNTQNSFSGFSNSLNTVLFNHNLWFSQGGNTRCFVDCQFLVITNNIFSNRNAAENNSNSTFNNNITFNTVNNTPWLSNNNIDGGGNISNQDPQMTSQASVNAGTDNPLADFTIAAGPANNAGIDGKDLGLLYDASGSLNWANSRNSRLARIFRMFIANPSIPVGGTLNVTVEGRKSN